MASRLGTGKAGNAVVICKMRHLFQTEIKEKLKVQRSRSPWLAMAVPVIGYRATQLGHPDHTQHRESWAVEKWTQTMVKMRP